MKMTYRATADHAPESGLGGAEFHVLVDGVIVGLVQSTWNRSEGVHWLAATADADGTVTDWARNTATPRKRTFRTKADAAAWVTR